MVSDKRCMSYYLYDAGGERTLKIIAPGCSLHFNRRLLTDITGFPFQYMEYKCQLVHVEFLG